MKHVVIVGAGFAGTRLARKLSKQKNTRITLINESEDFRYYPALYRVAIGENSSVSMLPLSWMLLGVKNVELVCGRAVKMSSLHKYIELETKEKIHYDECVLALGSVTTFFNIEGLHDRAYGMKSDEEIKDLKNHILETMKSRTHEQNYVIAGGGPTGVELSASFGSYIRHLEKRHKIKRHGVKIWLVEAADRILPTMVPKASDVATKRLKKLHVHVLTKTKVLAENAQGLKTDGGSIRTHTVIWTAGTACNPFFAENKDEFVFNERGRIVVNDYLQSHPSVYVIGDNASVPYAGLALTAIRHADFVAKDIDIRRHGKKRKHHHPKKPEVVIPIGQKFALFNYGSIVLSGRPMSWLRFIADLIGYKDVMGWHKAFTIWWNAR